MVKTISIDESKCDGCGLCVNACHEGALALVDGKAKLVKPNYCDGMGDCLPACPRNAISFLEDLSIQSTLIQPSVLSNDMRAVDQPGVQWPIQLALMSPASGIFNGTVVMAADCTAFKVENFSKRLVGDRPVVIGCPKLDDRARFDKLVQIFSQNPIDKVKVIRMEVPCCSQLTRITKAAVEATGKPIAVEETVIGRDGRILQ